MPETLNVTDMCVKADKTLDYPKLDKNDYMHLDAYLIQCLEHAIPINDALKHWNNIYYDADTWYDWACDNWGTECNANGVGVCFDTPWTVPYKWLERSGEFIDFQLFSTDEAFISRCPLIITCTDGELTVDELPVPNAASYAFACYTIALDKGKAILEADIASMREDMSEDDFYSEADIDRYQDAVDNWDDYVAVYKELIKKGDLN